MGLHSEDAWARARSPTGMKSLFATVFYPPPLEGGSLVYMYNLVSQFPSHDVLVYTNSKRHDECFDALQPYRIIRSKFLWPIRARPELPQKLLRMLPEWTATLITLLRRERFDILHAGDVLCGGSVAGILKKLFGIPTILYAYGEELNTLLRDSSLRAKLMRRWYRLLITNADGLVAVSGYTARLLEAFGANPKRICKILPMVGSVRHASAKATDEVAVKFGLGKGRPMILCAGRLTKRKGQDSLIRCLPRVLESFPDALLVIAGRGHDKDLLQTLAREFGVADRVVFTGYAEDEELAALFELCTVFASPLRELENGDTEGCPTVFLEAGAHGKPVVGGRAGGVDDAIIEGETGFIVDGTDIGQIASAIVRLLLDPELAGRLGARGRRRALDELTPARAASQVMEFSRRILEARRRS